MRGDGIGYSQAPGQSEPTRVRLCKDDHVPGETKDCKAGLSPRIILVIKIWLKKFPCMVPMDLSSGIIVF